jgi:hypothetical protein
MTSASYRQLAGELHVVFTTIRLDVIKIVHRRAVDPELAHAIAAIEAELVANADPAVEAAAGLSTAA